jgi:hypothetical protein
MLWKRILVRDHERILVAKNGKFHAILTPGKHVVFTVPGVSLELERFDIRDLVFRSAWRSHLVNERPELVAKHFHVIRTNRVQVAMVYADGKLIQVLPPRRRALYWRGYANITAEVVAVFGDLDGSSDDVLTAIAPAGR